MSSVYTLTPLNCSILHAHTFFHLFDRKYLPLCFNSRGSRANPGLLNGVPGFLSGVTDTVGKVNTFPFP